MQIISHYASDKIAVALSDCGRVEYAPIGNDAVRIDGRGVYQGRYCGSEELVSADLLAIMRTLVADVDAYNAAVREADLLASLDRAAQRDADYAAWRSLVPAHLDDDDL